MERLTIEEIIEHCKRKVEIIEKIFNPEILQKEDMHLGFMKEYWEHRQVAEYLEELKILRKLRKLENQDG